MLDASEAMHRLEAAVADAREFFGIDPLFDTPIYAEGAGNANARIKICPGYYHRPISVDLDLYQRRPDKIRADMAHEVAHLASDELACMFQRMPSEWSDADQPPASRQTAGGRIGTPDSTPGKALHARAAQPGG